MVEEEDASFIMNEEEDEEESLFFEEPEIDQSIFEDRNEEEAIRLIKEYLEFLKKLEEKGWKRKPIFSSFLEETEDLRNKEKKLRAQYPEGSLGWLRHHIMQWSYKLILVSTYGVMGYKTTRFFSATGVNMITFLSRWLLRQTMKVAEEEGIKVIYGDTDSIMFAYDGDLFDAVLKIDEIADRFNRKLRERIRKIFGDVVEADLIYLEPKKIYRYLLFTGAKKRYLGKYVWNEGAIEEKFEALGFEIRRSDSFELLRQVQRDLFEMFSSFSLEELRTILPIYKEELRRKLYSGKLDNLLILEKTVRGSLDKYKNKNIPHLRAARKLIERGLFRPGDRVRWVVVEKHGGETLEEPVPPDSDEVPEIKKSGYDYYWERLEKIFDRFEKAIGAPSSATLLEWWLK